MAAVALLLLTSFTAHAQPRRWALLIGENRGLQGEEPLRFAEADAQRVQDLFVELGDVPRENAVVLRGATAEAVRATLRTLTARMAAAGARQERLIVFVSSHAGEGVLHLAGTELPLAELVDFVKAAPVEVGLLLVDACRSGGITGPVGAVKGLVPAEAGRPRVEAAALEGRVLISASGADEYAQESDELQGSYFTHHLVTGLRGAADVSRDGRVTLDEAYRWAWARTVEATFASKGGVQRPAFKVDLRGQGELVLTEPRAASASLTLDVRAPGRWLVVAAAGGGVVADVEKPEGPATLALAPGAYRVRLRTAQGFLERQVELRGGAVTLSGDDLERASLVRVALKGRQTPLVVLSASATVSSPVVSTLGPQVGADARVRLQGDWLGPVNELSIAAQVRDAASALFLFHQTEVELRAGAAHHFEWARASLSLGVDLGGALFLQSGLSDGTSRTSLGLVAAAVVEGRLRIFGPAEAVLTGTGGGALVKKQPGLRVVPRGTVSLGLAFTF